MSLIFTSVMRIRGLALNCTCSSIPRVGAAKPREAVLAVRTGKTEEEILKEAVKGERPKLRLNAQQLEERQAAEVRPHKSNNEAVNVVLLNAYMGLSSVPCKRASGHAYLL